MRSPLPPLLVLTDRAQCGPAGLVDAVRACVEGGARAVVLREKDLPGAERAALAAELRPILHAAGGWLLVASDPTIESDGVHLAATDPLPDRRPALVGRSCHDRAEVDAAAAEGCDYVTLSPIFSSASKPGYGPALGPDRLRSIAHLVDLPVFALGGITTPEAASECIDAGASGVAIMGLAMTTEGTGVHLMRHGVRDCVCGSTTGASSPVTIVATSRSTP